jgi:hypothetical protein
MGSMKAAQAAKEEGRRKRAAANFEADQLDQQAGQQQAASQRVAADQNRLATYAESRAQAVAAASGAGGKTVSDVVSHIAQEGAYRSSLALYEGNAEARQMHLRAAANRFSGETVYKAGNAAATAHILNGASSLYAKYGNRIPSGSGSDDSRASGLSGGSGPNDAGSDGMGNLA